MANRKGSNNDLQNTTQKTKDPVTRTPLKTGLLESKMAMLDGQHTYSLPHYPVYKNGHIKIKHAACNCK